jgi:hypothetical protein
MDLVIKAAMSPQTLIENRKVPDSTVLIMENIVRKCRGNPTNLQIFGSSSFFFPALEKVLQVNLSSDVVSEPALHAIRFLCRHSDGKNDQNLENIRKLGELGFCEIVIQILISHGAIRATIAEGGLHAIRNLSSDVKNCQLLGNCGACEIVVQLLTKFGFENVFIANIGLGTICNLSIVPENSLLLGISGACELILQLLHKHGMTSVSLSIVALGSLWDISHDNLENRVRLSTVDNAKLILEILQLYVSNSSPNQSIALTASKVLFNLSRVKETKLDLSKLDIVDNLEELIVKNPLVYSDEAKAFASETINRLKPRRKKKSKCLIS